jgi:superfamily II DNA or RNA helicase
MATGTGKTITSLNCVLQEYLKNKTYRFIVLVPTISLAEQWYSEIVNEFNFQNCLICSSNGKWENVLKQHGKEIMFGLDSNFSVIATYATFRGLKFQNIINKYFEGNLNKLTLIADEAHTFGSAKLLKILPTKIGKRIGLSATPERVYDKYGQDKLCEFFNSYAPEYTFNYDMQRAIREGVLCKYYYYPRFVELEEEELINYKKITKKLYKYIDSKSGKYKDLPEVTNLLIRRKSIIHKAHNKLNCLNNITKEIGQQNFKYTFIYVPEGFEMDYAENDNNINDAESIKLIDNYAELLNNEYNLKLRKYLGGTKDRKQILMQFQQGKLNALLAMKCLDEGIDVPRAQYAIFCSSTGNPRQYVQRRGRILRTHEDKEYAFIYDMVVKPPEEITSTNTKAKNAENKIFEGELRRLVNFTSLAENKIEILEQINDLAKSYDIDIYEMLNKELEKYNDENTRR